MKTIVGLIVIAAMFSGVMVGCAAPPEEEVYQQVSVGPMTVSIPGDWERPKEYAEVKEAFTSALTPDLIQSMQIEIYAVPKSKDVLLSVIRWDQRQFSELQGTSWEGWESSLEAEGITKEEFVKIFSSGFIGKVEQLTIEVHRQLTIHGNEAWESQFTGKIKDKPTRINMLLIFAPDDMGILMMFVKEAAWGKFEGTWDKIRDSAELASAA